MLLKFFLFWEECAWRRKSTLGFICRISHFKEDGAGCVCVVGCTQLWYLGGRVRRIRSSGPSLGPCSEFKASLAYMRPQTTTEMEAYVSIRPMNRLLVSSKAFEGLFFSKSLHFFLFSHCLEHVLSFCGCFPLKN